MQNFRDNSECLGKVLYLDMKGTPWSVYEIPLSDITCRDTITKNVTHFLFITGKRTGTYAHTTPKTAKRLKHILRTQFP